MEYAEEYSKPEKYKRIILALLLGVLGLIVNEKWYLPFINWYADTVHCHTPFGYSGISVMWYSVLVGLPILCALIIGPFVLPQGIKGLIDKQFPPIGYKVFTPTKIVKGWKSKFKSIILVSSPVCLLLFSVWGYFQVEKMPHDVPEDFDYSICETKISLDVN